MLTVRSILQFTSILLLVRSGEGLRSRKISNDEFDDAKRSLFSFANDTDDVLEEPPILTFFSFSPPPTTNSMAPTPIPAIPTTAPVAPSALPVAPTVMPVVATVFPTPGAPVSQPGSDVPSTFPVTPTQLPVVPTQLPVAPTGMPVAPTQAPVAPTAMPVAPPTPAPVTPTPTPAPVTPTQAPIAPTSLPVVPTTLPVVPTPAPAQPTTAPVVPSASSVPSQIPVAPTLAPVEPTPAPVVAPTPAPVIAPTPAPVIAPTPAPIVAPTPAPVVAPTAAPVVAPTLAPVVPSASVVPSQIPVAPTPAPVVAPTPVPVATPTSAPLDPLLAELRSFIAPTDEDLLKFSTPTTPQAQALAWLKADPINLTAGRSTRTALERYVLAVLYFSTSGPNWQLLSDIPYLSGTSVCTWNNGLDLAGSDGEFGVYCVTGDQTSVDRLIMTISNLSGPFPWELVLLTNLVAVDLDGNFVSGTIPSRITELSKLELFWAYDNFFSGTLPATFSPEMYTIDLGYNLLIGSIPATFGANMLNLEQLFIYGNELTGTVPSSLGQIPVLADFIFSENSLTGSVDTFLCTAGRTWVELEADCQEVTCSCCTSCCVDNDAVCVAV
jgi:hypothetical protein